MAAASKTESRLVTEQNIFNYCISGDLKSLKECAHSVGQVVHKNSLDGQTCLIVACRNGHLDVAEYLIDFHGADVEQVGVVEFEGEQVEGVPPLWCAAAAGHLKLVELLVSRGADVNRTTITNSTALRAACFDGHEQVVRYLVEHGANIENPNRHGHTCLMISCYRRHDSIVEYLLSKNARVNRRSAKGNTALHDCTESGNLKCLQLLLNHRAIMRKDEYGQLPIMSGANAAFKKIVDFLATVDIPDTTQTISVSEKAAAYDLLGASLFDRHSLVQDAIAAWYHAINLRQELPSYNNNNKFIPHPVPKCTCMNEPTSCVEGQTTCTTTTTTSISSSNTPNNCWSLISLAAREAIGMAETSRTNEQNYSSSSIWQHHQKSAVINQILSKNYSSTTKFHKTSLNRLTGIGQKSTSKFSRDLRELFQRKFKKLQSDLQNDYQYKFECLGHSLYRLNSSRDYTFDGQSTPFCSVFLQGSHNSRFCQRSNSSSDCFDHTFSSSVLSSQCSISSAPLVLTTTTSSSSSPQPLHHTGSGVFVQSVTPVDPILGFEPKCCQIARYRRWLLEPSTDHQSFKSPTSTFESNNNANDNILNNTEYISPSKIINQCPNCKRILVSMNNSYLNEKNPFSNQSVCPICKTSLTLTNHSSNSSNANNTINTTQCSSISYPYGSNKNTHENNLKYICSKCHLATEDHPLIRRLKQCGEEAFGHVCEFQTREDLANLMQNTHVLRLQSLLIRLRILGPDHPDTIYFIRYRGAIYADADNFHQCLSLWRYALELQRTFVEPLCHVSQAAFVSFAELFHFVLTNNCIGLPANDLDPTLIVDCLELAVDNIERGMDYSFYHWHHRHPWSYTAADKEAINLMRHVSLCLHFIAMILIHYMPNCKALPTIRSIRRQVSDFTQVIEENFNDLLKNSVTLSNCQDFTSNSNTNGNESSTDNLSNETKKRMPIVLRQRFFRQVYRLVKLDPRVHRGQSLIHLACSPETSTVGRFVICTFPNVNVLSLLFELGADANCADVDGQRPIGHVLAQRRLKSSEHASLVHTLVKCGAHLDATNRNSLSILYKRFHHVLLESRVRILDHVTLACQAARVANHYGLTASNPSVQAYLPNNLLYFLQMHQ
ncbi:Protein fem-1 like [Schistosoma japonicum]|nr:Protein fem-1 like [Schistosoma japonicum]